MAFAKSGTAEIYYEVFGDGPALVFAHGRGGNAASWWQQVPTFSKDYKVIVYDHRCFGRSRCDPSEFDRLQFGSDLIAVLDAEEIENAAVVCQSMGGWSGLRAALENPGRVACLVLANTPAAVDLPCVRDALETARMAFASEGVGNAALAPGFAEHAPEATFLYRQIDGLNLQIPEALSFGSEGWVDPERVKSFDTPTLFLTSDQDNVLPPSVIKEVANLFPKAEFDILVGAGHSAYFEVPAAFNEKVLQFLTRFFR